MKKLSILLPLILSTSCSDSVSDDKANGQLRGEYIYRLHHEIRLILEDPIPSQSKSYPWHTASSKELLPITKEYFRCKGSNLNPPRIFLEGTKEVHRITDCGGSEKHSLPILNDKEHIYPILIALLNYVQEKTKKPVIITSGHRCPSHNTYVDDSPQNSESKHLIGAEVNFYVQGYENKPEAIVQTIIDFYAHEERYKDKKDFLEFKRFEKKTNVQIAPWYNKEILIKIFQPGEGRTIDNKHLYPYLSIQVRFDLASNTQVIVDNKRAQQFLRK